MLQNIFYNKEKKEESVSGTKNWSKKCMTRGSMGGRETSAIRNGRIRWVLR